MDSFPNIVLILWLAAVLVACFSRFPRQWVVLAAFVLGLLFLPMVGGSESGANEETAVTPLHLPGLTLTKYNVISLAVLLGLLVTDGGKLLSIRLSWWDLPMVAWCLYPLPSALDAPPPPDGSSPWKDGLTQTVGQLLVWGMPYFVGKQYLGSLQGLRSLALGFVFGAFLYVPLCLYEVKMSPQLHFRVYGFVQHEFVQTIRFDGYRPMVFMQHGLAVSLYMTTAALAGAWLWWTGAARHLSGPIWSRRPHLFPLLLVGLCVTAVLTKSIGALLLGMAGAVILFGVRMWKTPLLLSALLLVAPLYLAARVSGSWSGSDIAPLVAEVLGTERAESFEFRQSNEDMLRDRAFEGPVLGWGGWGRFLVQDRNGKHLTIPDGLWIILLGDRGLPGLIALYLAMLLPVVRFLCLQPARIWSHPLGAGAAVCAVVVTLYMIDNLMNCMHNHVFILMAGALAGLPRTSAVVVQSVAGAVHESAPLEARAAFLRRTALRTRVESKLTRKARSK
jgi:hypothetical protein